MEKCASNLASAPSVLLVHLQTSTLFRGNRSGRHAEQEESLASIKNDEVIDFCTIRSEDRLRTIRIDGVAPARRGIGPVLDFTVVASGRANEAARPVSVKDVDMNRYVPGLRLVTRNSPESRELHDQK